MYLFRNALLNPDKKKHEKMTKKKIPKVKVELVITSQEDRRKGSKKVSTYTVNSNFHFYFLRGHFEEDRRIIEVWLYKKKGPKVTSTNSLAPLFEAKIIFR